MIDVQISIITDTDVQQQVLTGVESLGEALERSDTLDALHGFADGRVVVELTHIGETPVQRTEGGQALRGAAEHLAAQIEAASASGDEA